MKVAANYAAEVMTDSPVSYWRMGETSGSTAADTADGNAGHIHHGVQLGVPGALVGDPNTAMKFDGNDFINIPNRRNLNIRSDLTVEAWANPAKFREGTQAVVHKGGYQYRIRLTSDNHWEGSVFIRGVRYSVISSAPAVIGQWDYLVMTRSGPTLKLYVNGVAVATTIIPNRPLDTTQKSLTIGRVNNGYPSFFHGSIDEVAIYNTALPPCRVTAHYTAAGRPNITSKSSNGEQDEAPTFEPPEK